MKVGLVGCSVAKLDQPAAARDLYVSPLFRGSRAYVERTCDRWFVLSAKYGLVAPEKVIAPYNLSLTDLIVDQRDVWGDLVSDDLREQLAGVDDVELVVLAGRLYRRWLDDSGYRYTVPMAGLGIGRQKEWLQSH